MTNYKIMKKASLLILALLLVMTMSTFLSFAASKEPIMDYLRVFEDEDLDSLNEYAVAIGDSFGIDIALLITDNSYAQDQDLAEYARECYFAHRNLSENGMILAVDSEEWIWDMVFFGRGEGMLTEDEMEEAHLAFDEADSYFDGVVGFYQTVEGILLSGSLGTGNLYIRDYGHVLSQDEVNQLSQKLSRVSDRHDFDVVVLTLYTLEGDDPSLYGADYLEENGYGRGQNDSCILVIVTEDRDFGFAALGFGNKAFTPVGQQYFDGYYLQHLRDNNFFEAFMAYGDAADLFLKAAKDGNPYDENNIPGQTQTQEEPKSKRGLFGGISVALAALIAKITTGSWKSQLKNVRREKGARKYVRQDSLNLTNKKDVFLYRNVNSTIIPKKEEASMGKSFKTSSGSKATGHSGKF